jgi:hypothetical protein
MVSACRVSLSSTMIVVVCFAMTSIIMGQQQQQRLRVRGSLLEVSATQNLNSLKLGVVSNSLTFRSHL